MAKKKSKWTFFRVILILGIFVAVAIFVLDRLLPKPYESDDLDDAWKDDDDKDVPDLDADASEAVATPPTADVAYDGADDDEGTTETAEAAPATEPVKKHTKKAVKEGEAEA